MKPTQYPSADWSLYYGGAYMQHVDRGPVRVRVEGHTMYMYDEGNEQWQRVDADELSHLWPEGQCINLENRGLYIGRRPRREARRSATCNHYFVAWDGLPHSTRSVSKSIMKILCFPPGYPSTSFAFRAIGEGGYLSVAITRDLILARGKVKGTIDVICRGEEAGWLVEIDGFREFQCNNEMNPASKRAMMKLLKEGVICH